MKRMIRSDATIDAGIVDIAKKFNQKLDEFVSKLARFKAKLIDDETIELITPKRTRVVIKRECSSDGKNVNVKILDKSDRSVLKEFPNLKVGDEENNEINEWIEDN